MTLYGYARVSVREPEDKNLDLQVERLLHLPSAPGHRAGGPRFLRPQWPNFSAPLTLGRGKLGRYIIQGIVRAYVDQMAETFLT